MTEIYIIETLWHIFLCTYFCETLFLFFVFYTTRRSWCGDKNIVSCQVLVIPSITPLLQSVVIIFQSFWCCFTGCDGADNPVSSLLNTSVLHLTNTCRPPSFMSHSCSWFNNSTERRRRKASAVSHGHGLCCIKCTSLHGCSQVVWHRPPSPPGIWTWVSVCSLAYKPRVFPVRFCGSFLDKQIIFEKSGIFLYSLFSTVLDGVSDKQFFVKSCWILFQFEKLFE